MGEVHANVVWLLAIITYLAVTPVLVHLLGFDEDELLAYVGLTMYVFILGTYLLS